MPVLLMKRLLCCGHCAGAPRVSSHFHQEFPSLQAAGEGEKGDGQEEEPYGPGPSLRPQSMATCRHFSVSIDCCLLHALTVVSPCR